MEITKDTVIIDLLREYPDIGGFFMSVGMHCIGCEAASGETIGEASVVHGIDPDILVQALKEYINHRPENA